MFGAQHDYLDQRNTEGIRTSLSVHFEMFKVSKIPVKNTLTSAKSEYYNKKIKTSKGNQRTVFSVVNKVLHTSQTHSK